MELVFDSTCLIYVLEGLDCTDLLDTLNERNGSVVVPRCIHAEFSKKPKDEGMPARLERFLCEDPALDGEVNPGVPGPLSLQDRTVLQAARTRGAVLVTNDDPLLKEARRLRVQTWDIDALLDHARAVDCVSMDGHADLKQRAAVLLARV